MLLALFVLNLTACGGNEHYPENYIGFKQPSQAIACRKTEDAKDISLAIIATGKAETDREMAISCQWDAAQGAWKPDKKPVYRLLDKKAVIPAGKQETYIRIRIFPQRIGQEETLRIICTPKDSQVQPTQMTLRLVAN